MRRPVYLLGVAIALVAGAFALTDALLTPPPGVTEANARHIRPGMTWEEVEKVLGGPGEPVFEFGNGLGTGLYTWRGADGEVFVWFHRIQIALGPVDRVRFQRARPTPLARLHAWLAGLAGDLPHDAGNLK